MWVGNPGFVVKELARLREEFSEWKELASTSARATGYFALCFIIRSLSIY
jgi:hypothetical protein